MPHFVGPGIAAILFFGFVSGPRADAGLVASNLPYASLHPDQIFDWYGPDIAVSGATPIVVFMHGAQGLGGDKSDVNVGSNLVLKDHLLQNGFTVMAIEFRPFPQFIYPTQIEDAALAIQYFKANAATYHIDPSHLLVWGLSGGAIIGGKLAYGLDYANPNGTPQQQISTRPLAFVNASGVTNFQLMVPWWSGAFFGKEFLYQVDPLVLKESSFSQNVQDIPRTFTPAAASIYSTNENPPPVTDPHDVTMMKDFHAHLTTGFPAVAADSLQLEIATGEAIAKFETVAEWTLHEVGMQVALNLGEGKAGSLGVEPKLEIAGAFAPGTTYTVTCHGSLAAPTTLYMIYGNGEANLSYAHGTLVPSIQGVVALPSDASGVVTINGTLPANLPSGVVTYLQFAHADPGASFGVALSNAVRVTTGS